MSGAKRNERPNPMLVPVIQKMPPLQKRGVPTKEQTAQPRGPRMPEDQLAYSFNNETEPVYIKNSDLLKLKWLEVKQIDSFEVDPTKKMSEILANPAQPIKKVVFSLLDENLYKCRTCVTVVPGGEKPPEICPQCNRATNFDVVTKSLMTPSKLWKLPIWEDIDIDMFEVYDTIISLLKRTIMFVEPIQYKLFALWIIATYKHPEWETIPYLHFRGLPASGKTRAMEMAHHLAYRSVLISGITFNAIVRANHEHQCTLCIDEIDTKLDERGETGRMYVDFLKSGYKKGALYVVCDLNDQHKIIYYNNYGFKILTGEKGIYNEALFSRTITFEMEQDYPEVMVISDVALECEQIKTKLMNYRFKTCTASQLGPEIKLRARYREIFDCLIRTAQHIGQTYDDLIAYAKFFEEEEITDLQGTDKWDVLNILYEASCQGTLDAREGIKISEIIERLEWDDKEGKRKNTQKLGYILKDFGLKTKRKKDGAWFSFVEPKNSRKMNYLFKRYRIGQFETKPVAIGSIFQKRIGDDQ
jgi:hypothetical protein